MTPLIGLTQQEISDELQKLGVEKYRAKQIWTWIYFHGVKNFDDMNNISKDIKLITNFVDELNLDNDLFKREVQ